MALSFGFEEGLVALVESVVHVDFEAYGVFVVDCVVRWADF
jgi:hypothetical protein